MSIVPVCLVSFRQPHWCSWCHKHQTCCCKQYAERAAQGISHCHQSCCCLQFVKDIAEGFLPSWHDIAMKRQAMPFSDEQRQWQLLRRGRYLEFNLLYDRGVKFGLSGGRLESIMVSAPPLIAWRYNVVPEAGSAEANLVAVLQKPVDWASPTT